MPWNPEQYHKFQSERSAPFYDLLKLVEIRPHIKAIDLGCGTGPIGQPIANSTCYVLDQRLSLLPLGAAGELFVGGRGLSHGYLHRPALTAERFVAHPFVPGAFLYKTGDQVRWHYL